MGITTLYGVMLIAVPVLLSLTLHEYGHARVAQAFGDPTARLLGRVTLNPLAHLDPLGTLCFLLGPVGWAKPVPVNDGNLRPARLGNIAVSLAGVGMNLALAAAAAVALTIMAAAGVAIDSEQPPNAVGVGAFMLAHLILINLSLLVFNLIPLYPLDGHHVLRELLPPRMHVRFMESQRRYGRGLLIVLLAAPWLLHTFGQAGAFDPIGELLHWTIMPTMHLLMPREGFTLAVDAWFRYRPFLPW